MESDDDQRKFMRCPACGSPQEIMMRIERGPKKYRQGHGPVTLYLRCVRCAQIQIQEQ